MFPHTVTLYNKYLDGGTEHWQRRVIAGVFWNSRQGEQRRKHNAEAVDGVQLLIPCRYAPSGYLKPQAWAALSQKSGFWTLAPGDTIVLGLWNQEIVRSTSELAALDDVRLITSVDERAFGSTMAHWEVSGK